MLTTLIYKGATRLESNRSPPLRLRGAALSRLRKGRKSRKSIVCRRPDVLTRTDITVLSSYIFADHLQFRIHSKSMNRIPLQHLHEYSLRLFFGPKSFFVFSKSELSKISRNILCTFGLSKFVVLERKKDDSSQYAPVAPLIPLEIVGLILIHIHEFNIL